MSSPSSVAQGPLACGASTFLPRTRRVRQEEAPSSVSGRYTYNREVGGWYDRGGFKGRSTPRGQRGGRGREGDSLDINE